MRTILIISPVNNIPIYVIYNKLNVTYSCETKFMALLLFYSFSKVGIITVDIF